ncbi:hypothetical protein E2C01_038597 [Portunus trituberculatus]|uniref:Uncharacterized protein n=1 Tax=Portunus trituberculatus TaxID=210409 RepID=A0A5B7FH87_PORTR|nr:hypothetical protein [Portunus trituberculatus]
MSKCLLENCYEGSDEMENGELVNNGAACSSEPAWLAGPPANPKCSQPASQQASQLASLENQ